MNKIGIAVGVFLLSFSASASEVVLKEKTLSTCYKFPSSFDKKNIYSRDLDGRHPFVYDLAYRTISEKILLAFSDGELIHKEKVTTEVPTLNRLTARLARSGVVGTYETILEGAFNAYINSRAINACSEG